MKHASRFLVVAVLCSGCAGIEQYHTGYSMTEYGKIAYENDKQSAEIKKQQAEILALYKDCLVRNQTDKSVDCSEFRMADIA